MESDTFLCQLHEGLSKIERRDWELWTLALGTIVALAVGFSFFIIPGLSVQKNIRIEADLSPQLAFGLLVLLALFILYLGQKHFQVKVQRHRSVLEALNFELAHAQLLLDPITKTLNRTAIEQVLGKEIKRAQRRQCEMVFLYVDIDDFKEVNTRYGHLTGDMILAEVGGLLKQCIRGSDYAIRTGGDEFLLALMDTDRLGGYCVKDRICDQVARWNAQGCIAGFAMNLSIGVEKYDGERSLEEVLESADSRMYAEKRDHKGIFQSVPAEN